ncbi:MAG: RNA polymerase sigma factor [Phycisphaerales bacterium]
MAEPIDATHTTTRLLDALHDLRNEPVWIQFDARFRPVLAGLARRLGLGGADAEEVAQTALAEFVRCYRAGQYDRSKGRLSSWLLGIAHHSALAVLRRNRRSTQGETEQEATDEVSLRNIWDQERDREILMHAIAKLREETDVDPRTLLAFELSALRGVPAPEVASQCEMTVEQVYVVKSRMTKRLRELVAKMTSAFEEDT